MKKYYILISLFTFLLMGCEEDNLHKPYGPDDGIAPGKVEVLSYTPTAGQSCTQHGRQETGLASRLK